MIWDENENIDNPNIDYIENIKNTHGQKIAQPKHKHNKKDDF